MAAQNSNQDSIVVKRVWGEYTTPIGLLRFGRMPNHWGLGMLANDGNAYDSDWGSTADRIMFVTGVKSWDLYFGALWDFTNEGANSANGTNQQGQPYDLGQADDVDQWGLVIARRRNPELQRLELARGDVVLNGGVFALYRAQDLANDSASESAVARRERGVGLRRLRAPRRRGRHPRLLVPAPLREVPLRGRGGPHLGARWRTPSAPSVRRPTTTTRSTPTTPAGTSASSASPRSRRSARSKTSCA